MASSARSTDEDQSHALTRRNLLQGLGIALIPSTLAACTHAVPPSKVKRGRSYITGEDHKKGRSCWNICDSEGRYNR